MQFATQFDRVGEVVTSGVMVNFFGSSTRGTNIIPVRSPFCFVLAACRDLRLLGVTCRDSDVTRDGRENTMKMRVECVRFSGMPELCLRVLAPNIYHRFSPFPVPLSVGMQPLTADDGNMLNIRSSLPIV